MKKHLFLGSTLALALAAGVGAQTPASGAGQGSVAGTNATAGSTQSASPRPTPRHDRTRSTMQGSHAKTTREVVTVEGCVTKEQDAAASSRSTGTSGRSAQAAPKDHFVLTNATIQSGTASPTAGSTSGATAGSSEAGRTTMPSTGSERATDQAGTTPSGTGTYGTPPATGTTGATAGSTSGTSAGTSGNTTPGSGAMSGSASSATGSQQVIIAGGRADELGLDQMVGQRVVVTGDLVREKAPSAKKRSSKHSASGTASMPDESGSGVAGTSGRSAMSASDTSTPVKVDIDSVRLIGSCSNRQ